MNDRERCRSDREEGAVRGRGWLTGLLFLVGFRNRLFVVVQWMWSFVSYDRGARLITGPLRRAPHQPRAERLPVPAK